MQQSATTLPVFVDLNVLPEELRPQQYPLLYVLGVLALLAASLALIPMYLAQQATDGETSHIQKELELMSRGLALVRLDLGRVRDLQQQLAAVQTDLATLNEERQAILSDGREVSQNLSTAILDLPPGVRLASVNGTDERMTLAGQALAREDVFEYVWTLRKSGRFSESRIVSLAVVTGDEEGSGVTFVIEAVR